MAGCGGDDTNSAAVGTATSAGGAGTLTWALDRRPTTLDPLYARSAADLLAARQVDEPLIEELRRAVRRDPDRRRGWRSRPGRRATTRSGGCACAPASASRTGRASTPRRSSPTSTAGSARPAGRRLLGELLVDAPRPDLVRFILPAADPHFDRVLASPRLGIVSPRAIAQAAGAPLDPGRFPESGTGPFELRERSADRLLLARNTDWWGTERDLGPGVDQLELLVVPNPAERLAMLRDGSARVAVLEPDAAPRGAPRIRC